MSTLILSSFDIKLVVSRGCLALKPKGGKLARLPVHMIDQVIVHHGVEIDNKALHRLAVSGVPTHF